MVLGGVACEVPLLRPEEPIVPPTTATKDYPLAEHHPDEVTTPTGKRLADITMEAVIAGDITAEDLRITPDTLRAQADIAASAGRRQLGDNFRRAAELTAVPDERILAMYNALRPWASTREQLLDIARELQEQYDAPLCAAHVSEAAEVYEQRSVLAKPEETS